MTRGTPCTRSQVYSLRHQSTLSSHDASTFLAVLVRGRMLEADESVEVSVSITSDPVFVHVCPTVLFELFYLYRPSAHFLSVLGKPFPRL